MFDYVIPEDEKYKYLIASPTREHPAQYAGRKWCRTPPGDKGFSIGALTCYNASKTDFLPVKGEREGRGGRVADGPRAGSVGRICRPPGDLAGSRPGSLSQRRCASQCRGVSVNAAIMHVCWSACLPVVVWVLSSTLGHLLAAARAGAPPPADLPLPSQPSAMRTMPAPFLLINTNAPRPFPRANSLCPCRHGAGVPEPVRQGVQED